MLHSFSRFDSAERDLILTSFSIKILFSYEMLFQTRVVFLLMLFFTNQIGANFLYYTNGFVHNILILIKYQ